MSLIGQTGRWRHNVLSLFVSSFVWPFICYQTGKHDVPKTNRPILMPIGNGMNYQFWGSEEGQSSRSHEVKIDLEAWWKRSSISDPRE